MPKLDGPLRLSPLFGTFPARYQRMEQDPRTDYELELWCKANQMEGIISPFIDSLKACVDMLVQVGNTCPSDAGKDRAIERFRRVIAAGEKAAEGLGIDEPKCSPYPISLILVQIPYNNTLIKHV